MFRFTQRILLYGIAGALGGAAAWAFILTLSRVAPSGIVTEVMLGAVAGMFTGGFIWSHEVIMNRQFKEAIKRACFGAASGLLGGSAGAALGNTAFTTLGKLVADAGGLKASLGIALAVALGWAVLGAVVGLSGGIMIRSRERAIYGLVGGAVGGILGGSLFNELSATSPWSVLAGLVLLGTSIGIFISLVEEAFISAKVRVVKGRHIGREFPLFKDFNVLGRDDRSDVCLSGAEGVGMKHAVIKRKNGRFTIESDEKGMVVYVNQKLTRSSKLADGDVIRVGSILLMFSAIKKVAVTAAVLVFFLLSAFVTVGSAATMESPSSIQITQFDLSSFPLVKVYISVLDSSGKPIRGITREALTLSENTRHIAIDHMQMSHDSGIRVPLSLSIVIDRSGSMAGKKIIHAKESVLRFISLMEPGDHSSLFAFSDHVSMLSSLTDDQDSLRKSVLSIQPGGHTALYDAIASGVESVQGSPGRKAVIVLTDGIANRGALDIDQAIASGIKNYVSVYTIGLGRDVRTQRLERIANETGGSYFFTPAADGLAEIYDTISNRIRNEYVISYWTDKRADYLRNVSVGLASGQRATRTYFQPESSLFGAAGELPPLWAFAVSLMSLAGLLAMSFRAMDHKYMTGHLSVIRGQGTKSDIDIGSEVTIGRDKRSAIGLLKDNNIANNHATIVKENDRYVIEDKGSITGTFVNKKKIAGRHVLEDGDIIDVGNATMVFSEETKEKDSSRICEGCREPIKVGAKFCIKCGVKAA